MKLTEDTRNEYISFLGSEITVFQSDLEKWKESFQKKPIDALQWSYNVFDAAAYLSVYEGYERILKFKESNGYQVPVETIIDALTSEVIRESAGGMEHMSSPVSCLAINSVHMAKAKLLERFLGRR